MLDEYFRLEFDAEKETIVAVPDLLQGYTPSPTALPLFLVRLATTVSLEKAEVATEVNIMDRQWSIYYAHFRTFFLTMRCFGSWLHLQVDWDDEQRCFEGVANEISEFYSDFSRFLDEETEEKGGEASIGTRTVPEKYEHFLQVNNKCANDTFHVMGQSCYANSTRFFLRIST